ncbi:MAG: bifunctional hydroxymethylpyrimidine kinase/phosphomethylpyrimidine kinase [Muribaculaceae bacterium]|nr:bifunctional hydroxymethylpyrimidine kinase/phosphomethylpyrimidine kinase [Muribaculaceae bacterium]
MTQPIILSIAGSDNTGGAGIQADIKTCCAFRSYAATVITGVTAQNCYGVYGVEPVSMSMLDAQIDAIFQVMTPGAVKTGMLPSPEIIVRVAEKMQEYEVKNLIIDPVMVATNGGNLIPPGKQTINAFRESLMPIASIITPNVKEASALLGKEVKNADPLKTCREIIATTRAKAVLLKGGHSDNPEIAIDYLYDGDTLTPFASKRIDTENTHGTGCTLSSAIACGLANGMTLTEAVSQAKAFISKAIESAKDLKISKGPGMLDFFAS